ncbi:MAG: hypothetical protein EXS16_07615 [Gemmataceae bacterium]|nr:hypothetical protein [Gemmataceae bacterium]
MADPTNDTGYSKIPKLPEPTPADRDPTELPADDDDIARRIIRKTPLPVLMEKGPTSRFKKNEPGKFALNAEPAQQAGVPNGPTKPKPNPYTEGTHRHTLFEIIAANPGLISREIKIKTGDSKKHLDKYDRELARMVNDRHIEKTDGKYFVTN